MLNMTELGTAAAPPPTYPDVFSDTNPRREDDHEATYNELCSLFELDTVTPTSQGPDTLLGVSIKSYIAEYFAHEDMTNPDVQRRVVLEATRDMKAAIALLEAYGYDFDTFSPKAIDRKPNLLSTYEGIWDTLNDMGDALANQHSDPQFAVHYFATQLLSVTSSDRRGNRHRKHWLKAGIPSDDSTPYDEIQREAVTAAIAQEEEFFRRASRFPDYTRKSTLAAVNTLKQQAVTDLLQYEAEKAAFNVSMEEPPSVTTESDAIKGQELNFTVLPQGTVLRQLYETIRNGTPPHLRPYVDTSRLQLLEEMSEFVGKEKCFYAQGIPKERDFVVPATGELVNESYVVLVMQDRDDDGRVVGENAIAISPIARRNAAFVCRYDVSEGISWQEILKFPKQDVELLGARRVKFSHSKDQPLGDAMLEKFTALLTCDKAEFDGDFRRNKDGSYILRHRRSLGKTALGHNSIG